MKTVLFIALGIVVGVLAAAFFIGAYRLAKS